MKKFLQEAITYFWIPLILGLVSYIFFQLRDILLGIITLISLSAVYTLLRLYFLHKKWWLLPQPRFSLIINNQLVIGSFVSFEEGSVGLAILGSVMNNQFATELISRLPTTIKAVIPPERLASLANNPQALVSPEAQAQLQGLLSQMGSAGSALFEQILQALRQALSSALSEVFLIGLFTLIVAFIVNLLIREIPLRRQHTLDAIPPEKNQNGH